MFVDYDWSFDAANRITSMDFVYGGNNYTADYTNDDSGQLTEADYDYQGDENYEYDDNGNRVNGDYEVGDNNQMTAGAGYAYTYDAEGNRQFRFVDADSDGLDGDDSDITKYVWDHRNRLTGVTHYDDYTDYDSELSDQAVEYKYDHQNHLTYKLLDPDGSDGSATVLQTAYAYDGDKIILQFEKEGAGLIDEADLSHRYLWGAAVDQILADETVDDGGPEDVLWTLGDHLNTVRDLAAYDPGTDTTTIENHRIYDAFGKMTSENNSAVDCIFGFTGRMFDTDAGLQNNLNRWYDPTVGRWLSEDPIKSDWNLYRYVFNNPTNETDPTGLQIGGGYGTSPLPHAPDPNDVAAASAKKICAKIAVTSANCKNSGCTLASCEKSMTEFIKAVNNTWILNIFGLPLGPDTCSRWVLDLNSRIPKDFLKGSCISGANLEEHDIVANGGATTVHWTFYVTLCDGTKINADNGAWGGDDHLF